MAIKSRPKGQRGTQAETVERLSRVPASECRRLNVPVPPDLYRQMRRRALDEDRSLAAITRELWIAYLSRDINDD